MIPSPSPSDPGRSVEIPESVVVVGETVVVIIVGSNDPVSVVVEGVTVVLVGADVTAVGDTVESTGVSVEEVGVTVELDGFVEGDTVESTGVTGEDVGVTTVTSVVANTSPKGKEIINRIRKELRNLELRKNMTAS